MIERFAFHLTGLGHMLQRLVCEGHGEITLGRSDISHFHLTQILNMSHADVHTCLTFLSRISSPPSNHDPLLDLFGNETPVSRFNVTEAIRSLDRRC